MYVDFIMFCDQWDDMWCWYYRRGKCQVNDNKYGSDYQVVDLVYTVSLTFSISVVSWQQHLQF